MKALGIAGFLLASLSLVSIWACGATDDETPTVLVRDLVVEDLGRPAVPPLARKLNEIHEYEGLLYLGFGDWVENSGPTDVITFDPEHRVFHKEFKTQEHAIVRYRELDGSLVIPGIDGVGPQGSVVVHGDEGWEIRSIGARPVSHVFDIADFMGTWFAAVDGWILSSKDRGDTWHRALNAHANLEHQTRVVCLAVQHERLYAFPAIAMRGGSRPLADARGRDEADVWDGEVWTRQDILAPGYERCVEAGSFRGDLITYAYHALPAPQRRVGLLQRFDGDRTEVLASPFHGAVLDLEASNHALSILGKVDSEWKLGVTEDLVDWTLWNLPTRPRPLSAWIHQGRIYLGGDDGHLYRQKSVD